MFQRHFSGFRRPSRFFEKGDMKYVILDLLKTKPAHGYEIIRSLEERFQGFYTPSAGSVYPTLQLLEDMGYVEAAEQDGKKIYTITEEGKRFLEKHENIINKIKEHMHVYWGVGKGEEFFEIKRELRDTLHLIGQKAQRIDHQKLIRIKEIITKAHREIEAILEQRDSRS